MNHSKIPQEGTEEFDAWINGQLAKREYHLFLQEQALQLEEEGRKGLMEIEMEGYNIEV